MSLGKLLLNLGVNTGSFDTDLGRSARLADKRAKQIQDSMGKALRAVGTYATAGAAALATFTKTTANTADAIQKASNKLGVSTEFLSQYSHAAELSGINLERFSDGLKKSQKTVNDANNGLSTAVRAFDALGISLDQINQLSPEAQFELIADRISKVENQSVKAGAAMDIFGRAGSDMLPLLNAGAEGLKQMREEADAYGLTITQEAADASAQFNDEITRLNGKIEGFTRTIGMGLIPVATEMVKQFNSPGMDTGNALVEKLQTTMITLYGATQLVGDGFEVVGKAVGLFAVKGVQAFELVGGYLDSFVQRVKLGAKIIQSAWSDEADVEAQQLGLQIAELETRLQSLYDTFKNDDIGFSTDAKAIFDQTINDLQELKKVAASAGKGLNKDLTKPLGAAGDASGDLSDGIDGINGALGRLGKNGGRSANDVFKEFESITQSLETPLESLDRQFREQIETLGLYITQVGQKSEAGKKAAKVVAALTEKYIDNKEAVESTLSPYDRFIKSINDELSLLGLSGQALEQRQAQLTLEQNGISVATVGQEKYNEALAKELQLRGALNESQRQFGTYGSTASGSPINSFMDLINNAFSIGDLGGSITDAIKDGFSSVFSSPGNFAQGVQGFAQGLGTISSAFDQSGGNALRAINGLANGVATAALGMTGLSASLAAIAGPIAAVTAVLGVIDSLSGGKVFGTSYETKRTTRNLNINSAGGSGNIETLQTKQGAFFSGLKRRTKVEALDQETLAALDQLFDQLEIALQSSAAAVGGNASNIISGSFSEEFDKNGNLVSQMATVLGRTYQETFEQFSKRLTAENMLAGIGSVFDNVSQIAEQWRGDADKLLDGAQLLLQAGVDINAGSGLFDTLDQVTTAITGMQKPGESLVETYSRVQGSVLQLDEALSVIGQSFEMARADYVQFAADITDAAGGVQQAASLWQSYFETFYTEQELAANALASATQSRDSLLGNLGIDTDVSTSQFRELFENVLPSLSAEAVVEWLRAADAIGVVVELESELNAQREENAEKLSALIGQINNEIESMGLSPFALELKRIKQAFQENIKSARALGAGERELAMIQTYASRQIQQAISLLESDLASSIVDRYGTELDQVNQQIALLEQQQSQIGSVAQASSNRYEQELRAIQNIQRFVDDLFLDEQLSPLNPMQQLSEAQRQFNEMLAQAQGGDIDALNALPGLAQTLLGFGREVYASSSQYTDLFNFVTESLSALDVTSQPGGDNTGQVIIGQNSQMIDLLARQAELQEQYDAQAGLDAALNIANMISEYLSVTEESFQSLADRLGIPVEAFLADLGISLEELTVETTMALADTANLLGIEITELADSVGESLGALADDQSLLNDALEATIAQLPDGIAGQLDEMLTAIETSTDPAAREELLAAMVDFISSQPANISDMLAPYFDDIDTTTDAQQQVSEIQSLNATTVQVRDQLRDMLQAMTVNNGNDDTRNAALIAVVSELSGNVRQVLDLVGTGG